MCIFKLRLQFRVFEAKLHLNENKKSKKNFEH